MSEWLNTTLGDLCADGGGGIQTGPFGSQLHASDYVEVGTPVVMPQNIRDNYVDLDGIARISDAELARLERYELLPGDIVYSRRGDVERRALIRPKNAGWLCGTGCLRVRLGDDSAHDATFISYALGLKSTREWIVRHAVGATMLNLNTSILSAVPLRVPGVDEQRAISEVLGALDDKIAANTRLAATADELIRNRYLVHEVDGLGTCKVGNLAENVRVQVRPGEATPDAPYVGLEHVPRRHMFLDEMGYASEVTSAKTAFEAKDVLFGKLRPYFHKVVSAPMEGICSTDILVVRACDPELAGFLLAAASSDSVIAQCSAHSQGTRMPRTNWKDLSACEVRWPGTESARAMSSDISGLTDLMAAKSAENRQLARTRDALLPLLMSGRVTVKDAESEVEGVA